MVSNPRRCFQNDFEKSFCAVAVSPEYDFKVEFQGAESKVL
jgi:hypothetical protein